MPERAEELAETPPEVSVSVRLSPVHLSLAYSEVILMHDIARQLAPLLQPADVAPEDSRGVECGGCGDDGERGDGGDAPLPLNGISSPVRGLERASSEVSHLATSPASLRSARADERGAGVWTARLGVLLEFECEQGVWLRLLDDSEGATLPLAELGVRQLFGHMRCSLGSKDGGGGGGGHQVLEGDARLGLQLQASNFNPRNGAWEPVLEPWSLHASWELSASVDTLARAAAGGASGPHMHMLHALSLTATERLEVRVG